MTSTSARSGELGNAAPAATLTHMTIGLRTRDVAARICALHLERLGAAIAADTASAEIELVGPDGRTVAAGTAFVTCEFEEYRPDFGGLVASEATAQAALSLPDYLGAGNAPRERTGTDLASSVAGFVAAQHIMAAIAGGATPERPARLATSSLRALATLKSLTTAARADPDEWTGTHVVSREKLPDTGYATADGRITLDFDYAAELDWLAFVEALGLDHQEIGRLRRRWSQTVGWGDDVDFARPMYEKYLRRLGSADAMSLIRAHGGSSVSFLTPDECMEHPQGQALELRRSFERGIPFRVEATESGVASSPDGWPGSRSQDAPLAGLRVVDLGVGGVGPFAPMLLATLGADVVKVEPPSDFVHQIGPRSRGISTTYLACNAGKRSVCLDLKTAKDLDLLWQLLTEADVVSANFRPSVLDRLGLSFDLVSAVNPAVVYAATTGYGWCGPLANEPCTDPHAQAFAGFAATNANADGLPRRLRYVGLIDVVTSSVIAEAICAGILERQRTGRPVHVQTSMIHAVLEMSRTLTDLDIAAPDGLFPAADEFIALTCRDDGEWDTLVDVLGRPSTLRVAVFAHSAGRRSHDDELRHAMGEILRRRAAQAWAREFGAAGIPCVRLMHDDEIIARRDYWADGLFRPLLFGDNSPLVTGGPPVRYVESSVGPVRAPLPGEHTEQLRADPSSFWFTHRSTNDA